MAQAGKLLTSALVRQPVVGPWCNMAEMPECTIFMMSVPCLFFTRQWARRGLGKKVQHILWKFQGDFCQAWYPRREFDAEADFLSRKMLTNPRWALRVISQVERYSQRFFVASKYLRRLNFTRFSDQRLATEFQKVLRWHNLSGGIGPSVSWHADADQERVSKALLRLVERRSVRSSGLRSPAEAFSLLTTPAEQSFAAQEERAFLRAAVRAQRSPLWKSLRRSANLTKLRRADAAVFRTLERHANAWAWLPYAYRGPAYNLASFLDRWQALVQTGQDPAALLAELRQKHLNALRQQALLVRSLDFTAHEQSLLRMAQRMVFIKDFRKAALYHGMWCYEPFLRELGRRRSLNLEQVWAMDYREMLATLRDGSPVDAAELSARAKRAVCYYHPDGEVILSGPAAERFFRALPKEQRVPAGEVSELRGTCACPGQAQGVVKIVETPTDITKMRQGNVLVSETTYPSLVPAMKLAAAIVTNAGGLTSHAAIVARELGIPCVVGTKIANKVLKDGDLVEVDATKGTVRRV